MKYKGQVNQQQEPHGQGQLTLNNNLVSGWFDEGQVAGVVVKKSKN
jgi:hypothetical protein